MAYLVNLTHELGARVAVGTTVARALKAATNPDSGDARGRPTWSTPC